jgi:hypothetical protein
LEVALYPQARFTPSSVDFWSQVQPDDAWWLVWFERYQTFALHHARLASETGAAALILGGDWVQPALPGGQFADGVSSGLPADSETRWRNLIAEIRKLYSGELIWSLPSGSLLQPPPFLDAVDGIYLAWNEPDPAVTGAEDPQAAAAQILDEELHPLQILFGHPVILGFTFQGEDPSLQAEAYRRMLELVSERDWISGFASEGFSYPAPDQAVPTSVNGRPAGELLQVWYAAFTKQ